MLLSLIVSLQMSVMGPPGEAQPVPPTSDRVCAILAAVGRAEHALDRQVAPPLRAGGDFLPDCDWAELGLRGFASRAERPSGWFIFHRPIVRRDWAVVEVAANWAPRAGRSSRCKLRERRGQWEVTSCATTRVS